MLLCESSVTYTQSDSSGERGDIGGRGAVGGSGRSLSDWIIREQAEREWVTEEDESTQTATSLCASPAGASCAACAGKHVRHSCAKARKVDGWRNRGLEKRWTSYSPAVKWINFCARGAPELGLAPQRAVPASREAVEGFLLYLQQEGRVHAESMNVYVSAIGLLHRDLGYASPFRRGQGLTPARNARLLASLVAPAPRPALAGAEDAAHESPAPATSWRWWKLCGDAAVGWIRFCQQAAPAARAVPAAPEILADYVDFLVRQEATPPDRLAARLSAVRVLHQTLGYPDPVSPVLLAQLGEAPNAGGTGIEDGATGTIPPVPVAEAARACLVSGAGRERESLAAMTLTPAPLSS